MTKDILMKEDIFTTKTQCMKAVPKKTMMW
jgi:hypothetical protein